MNKTFEFLDGLKTKLTDFRNSLSRKERLTITIMRIVRNAIWYTIGILTYIYL